MHSNCLDDYFFPVTPEFPKRKFNWPVLKSGQNTFPELYYFFSNFVISLVTKKNCKQFGYLPAKESILVKV